MTATDALFLATYLIAAFSQLEAEFEPCVVDLAKGEAFRAAEYSVRQFYLILEGAVKLIKIDQNGREIPLALLGSYRMFSFHKVVSEHGYCYSAAVALSPVELLSISAAHLQLVLVQSPQLGSWLVQERILRLLHAQKLLEIYARPRLSFRLVSVLLLLACDFGVATDAGIRIELKLTHQALAQLIRANRTSVSLLLNDLQRQKLISVERQRITLHEPTVLAQIFGCL